MVEYANDLVIKLLKQYDMLAKSLNLIDDIEQQNELCHQMTKIIEEVVRITNSIYEKKFKQVSVQSVYLMDDERNRLSELINLIQERRAYVNNQITSNQELTGISFSVNPILGEDKLEEYKSHVKLIDKYKNNVKLEVVLKEEIQNLEVTIRKANHKINNNKNLNRQLEDKMIRIVGHALEKLSLFGLQEHEKEIELAYTELGYSLEKAKENAKIARRDCSEDIILECDNILASTTLDYERYKEKKLVLQLIDLYKKPVSDYDALLNKREEINNILLNITGSELYSMIGNELNKEYSTIKLEAQDVATLNDLVQEKELKQQQLEEINRENASESVQGLLSTLLENERKYQARLDEEKKKQEAEKLRLEKIEEQKRIEERVKRQKELEEERKKEIEQRTKQLLVEKKNSVLSNGKDTKETKSSMKSVKKVDSSSEIGSKKVNSNISIISKGDDFFSKKLNSSAVKDGIPVVKNNRVVSTQKEKHDDYQLFPDIPTDKKKNIFPDIKEKDSVNSFFNENEFNDLSNYMEGSNKKNWF